MLIVLTGKTASGKDTVMSQLLLKIPDLKKIVTTTSRTPRKGETEGIDYNFISEQDFKQKIDQGEFIEYVEYGGNLYGTRKSQILDNLDNNLIWRIDPSRAGQIREFLKSAFDKNIAEDLFKKLLVIYLTTADGVILERLRDRGLNQEEIERRMQDDSKYWQQYEANYDFVLENIPGQLDTTVDKIIEIVKNTNS